MPCDCASVGLDEIFNERFVRRDAAGYRKHGPPRRVRHLLGMIEDVLPLEGRSSLEGGAGAGVFTVELARRGVAQARAIDATRIAAEYTNRLAREFQVDSRVQAQMGDFADPNITKEPADLVILDRVVCCYPDWRALLGNATQRARRVVALSFPPGNLISKLELVGINTFQSLLRRRFRFHLHPPSDMLAYMLQEGFTRMQRKRYWGWELVVAARTD